jgi:glutathione S-transferase
MKLFFSPASPYVRKVRLAAIAAGIGDQLEFLPVTVTPIAEDMNVSRANPLGKLPTLLLDDGTALYDSGVIVEYLDTIGKARLLPPPADKERWRTLRYQAAADGICDAAILMRYENFLRPEQYRWAEWTEGQWRKVLRAADMFEAEATHLEGGAPLNGICAAYAFSYLDFRLADRDWRSGRPRLAAFYERYSQRPEMKETAPA